MRISSLYRISIAVKYAKAFSAFIQCHHIGRRAGAGEPTKYIELPSLYIPTDTYQREFVSALKAKYVLRRRPPWVHAHLCALELRLCHTMFLALLIVCSS
ncbi:hypothetical protein EVAR_102331_1 [Eumeta japonica]|uniref:Uncharacterized protein n=1 Tax=Eumeta variegata TaxID=151549 RepID=A0A4C1ZH71_EUMVA|nr:hypothetical protein EVAR_102331_1 [Eumeta japonica]